MPFAVAKIFLEFRNVAPKQKNSLMVKKILICDDDETLHTILKFVFNSEGHDVLCISHGALLMESVSEFQPNLILLDIMLPDENGFVLLQKLKSNESTSSIPVITVSGLESRDHIDGAMNLGAAHYLVKPFEPTKIKQIVRNILGE